MKNEMTMRTPAVIAAEIRALTSTMLTSVIEIGRRMAEAKALMEHGSFLPWLKENTGYSKRTAENFMRLFEAYGEKQQSLFGAEAKSQTFANLPYSKALALLSVPENEREAFAADHEGDTLKELKAAIQELSAEKDKAVRRAQEAENEAAALRDRPTEVAVREPTKEELDAMTAAMREEQKQMQMELEEKQDTVDAMKRQLAEEKKRAAMKDEAVIRFKEHFTAWQNEWAMLIAALDEAQETEKLLRALAAVRDRQGADLERRGH